MFISGRMAGRILEIGYMLYRVRCSCELEGLVLLKVHIAEEESCCEKLEAIRGFEGEE